jgi:excisionase family DNA binding protein
MTDDLLTTAEAATRLGLSAPRIRQLVLAGRLPATKHGRDWLIKTEDLAQLERRAYRRGPGEGQTGQSLSMPVSTLGIEEERP